MAYNNIFDQDVDIMQPSDNNQVTYMNTFQSNGIREETNLGFRDQSEFVMQVQSL